MLYKIDEYWQDEILKASSLVNKRKIEKDCADFIHIGNEVFIDVESLLSWIENLDYELEHTREDLKDVQQDIEDNCIRRTAWEDSGMRYEDFI